jgi:hypothetical protein
MLVTQRGPKDRQRPAHQRLGLRQTVRVLQQLRQVVEVDGNVGVICSEGPLVDGQRSAYQRLGLDQTVRGLEQLSQVDERDGNVGVVSSVELLVNRQRAAYQRFSLGRPIRRYGASAPDSAAVRRLLVFPGHGRL